MGKLTDLSNAHRLKISNAMDEVNTCSELVTNKIEAIQSAGDSESNEFISLKDISKKIQIIKEKLDKESTEFSFAINAYANAKKTGLTGSKITVLGKILSAGIKHPIKVYKALNKTNENISRLKNDLKDTLKTSQKALANIIEEMKASSIELASLMNANELSETKERKKSKEVKEEKIDSIATLNHRVNSISLSSASSSSDSSRSTSRSNSTSSSSSDFSSSSSISPIDSSASSSSDSSSSNTPISRRDSNASDPISSDSSAAPVPTTASTQSNIKTKETDNPRSEGSTSRIQQVLQTNFSPEVEQNIYKKRMREEREMLRTLDSYLTNLEMSISNVRKEMKEQNIFLDQITIQRWQDDKKSLSKLMELVSKQTIIIDKDILERAEALKSRINKILPTQPESDKDVTVNNAPTNNTSRPRIK